MTGPSQALETPTWAALARADRVLVAATCVFLFLACASGSAGLRGAMLTIASAAVLWSRRLSVLDDLSQVPRALALACVAWAGLALASVAWSVSPRFTLGELRSEVGYGLLTFALFFVAALRLGRWRAWWIAIVAGTLVVFLAQLAQDLVPLRLSRHPIDGGPGPWSTHLVLIAPLLLVLVWPRPWGFYQGTAVKVIALLLLLVAAADTANRIVWAAFAAQLLVVWAVSGAMPAMEPARVATLRRLTFLAGLALVVGFGASVLERNVRHYRADTSVTASIDRDLRPKLWSVARDEIRKAPWLGHGFGREILEERFLPHTPPKQDHPPMRHAHNTFVDMALQVGALGLACFLAIWLALAREYLRYLREAALAPLGVIGLALLAGYATKNFTDDFFYRHNGLVFWALNGVLLGLGQGVRRAGAKA